MARSAIHELTPGENIRVTESWQIAGIIVENPSGQWLYVNKIRRYVPPFTLMWRTNIERVSAFRVNSVAAPVAGSTSSTVGGPVIIMIFDREVGYSNGYTYDISARLAAILASLT